MKKRQLFTEAELWRTEPYNRILSFLKHGADLAIPAREICCFTGLDERSLRKDIETIRRSGVCVLSSVAGYYYPLNKREVERYIRRTERAAKSAFYTLKAARAALKKFENENGGK